MVDIAQLTSPTPLEQGSTQPPVILYRAVIKSTPTNASQPVMVNIPARDPEGKNWLWGPCPWSPRILNTTSYAIPSAGDLALVAFTEQSEPWVIEWWPYAL